MPHSYLLLTILFKKYFIIVETCITKEGKGGDKRLEYENLINTIYFTNIYFRDFYKVRTNNKCMSTKNIHTCYNSLVT